MIQMNTLPLPHHAAQHRFQLRRQGVAGEAGVDPLGCNYEIPVPRNAADVGPPVKFVAGEGIAPCCSPLYESFFLPQSIGNSSRPHIPKQVIQESQEAVYIGLVNPL